MKSLGYLFFTSIKNSLKELIKHPSKLIMYIVFIALIVFVVISTKFADAETEVLDYRSITEFGAIVLAFYTAMFVMMSMKGLTSGASFFSMPDVNLLFVSPLSSIKILLFGIIKQMGMSLLVGVFIFYQYAWIHNTYGVTFGNMLFVFLGYCFTVFCSQVTAMAIYSFSCNSELRKNTIKGILIAIGAVCVLYVLYPALTGSSDIIGSIAGNANSHYMEFIPVAGWLKWAVYSSFSGDIAGILAGFGLSVIYSVVVILYIALSNTDYYEDVLQATEISYTAISAKKQGKVAEVVPKNVKVGKTGINKGEGASAFFYKHMLENRRASVFVIDFGSLIFVIMSCLFAFFMKDEGIIPIFAFITYMQIFSCFMGRWLKELLFPYVYLIPISPFKKLIMICSETLIKTVAESVVLYVIIGFILAASPIDILFCIIARISFGFLFMAATILVERVLGSMTNKVVITFLYFIIMILVAAPGIVLGIVLMSALSAEFWAFLLLCTLWNAVAGLLIFFLCRDILNYAELNNR